MGETVERVSWGSGLRILQSILPFRHLQVIGFSDVPYFAVQVAAGSCRKVLGCRLLYVKVGSTYKFPATIYPGTDCKWPRNFDKEMTDSQWPACIYMY